MKDCYPLIDVGPEFDVKPTLMALDRLASIFLWAKLSHYMQDILLGVPRALTYTGSSWTATHLGVPQENNSQLWQWVPQVNHGGTHTGAGPCLGHCWENSDQVSKKESQQQLVSCHIINKHFKYFFTIL